MPNLRRPSALPQRVFDIHRGRLRTLLRSGGGFDPALATADDVAYAGRRHTSAGAPEEEALLQVRAALIRIMQDRTRGIPARLNALCEAVGTVMPTRTAAEWADFLRTLERLDPTWDAVLARLTNAPDDLPDFSPLAVEQFTVYLLHRHVPGALLDGDLPGRVLFCAVSGMLFLRLSTLLGENEAARMYSSEIEYSEENLCSFLDELDAAGDE